MKVLALTAMVFCLITTATHATTLTFREGDGGSFSTVDGTYIDGLSANSNYGTSTTLRARYSNPKVVLVKFSDIFGSSTGQIAPGATIDSATLSLRTGGYMYDSSDTHNVYVSLIDWFETTATWANFVGADNTLDAGVEYSSTLIDSFVPDHSNTTYDIDVTSVVQMWSDDVSSNYGFVILNSGDDQSYFLSDDTSTHGPTLAVDYSAQAIPEPATIFLTMFGFAWIVRKIKKKINCLYKIILKYPVKTCLTGYFLSTGI